jgi:ribosomal protein S19
MSRSLKKGPYVDEKLMQKVAKKPAGDKEPIKT